MKKDWLKQNWFKIVITATSVSILVLVSLQYLNSNKVSDNTVLSTIKQVADINKSEDTHSDTYIVTHDKDGNPLDWITISRAMIILSDSVDTFKASLPYIEKTQEKERALDASIIAMISKTDGSNKVQMQSLLQYSQDYVASGDKVVNLLTNLIKDYQGMIKATNMRDAVLYLYYSSDAEKFDSQKNSIMLDYSNKQKIKQNYAASIVLQ